MNISNRFLQKYYLTRKLYVWALALIYISPISLLAAQQLKEGEKNALDKIYFLSQQENKKKEIIAQLKGGGKAWERLKNLLDSNKGKGIPTLDLSYDKINLPFDLLFDHSKNQSCRNIIENMVKKQPNKRSEFIKEALKKLPKENDKLAEEKIQQERKVWFFLIPVLEKPDNFQLKKDYAEQIFKDFTAKKYVAGMKISKKFSYNSNTVRNITLYIIEKSDKIVKNFVESAFRQLEVAKDKESIEHIWQILSRSSYDIEDAEKKLGNLNYHQLDPAWEWGGGFGELLKKLLKNDPGAAQKLVNKAFEDNNQKSENFWELLYFLIVDPKGAKKNATQIAQKLVEKALKDGDQKFKKLEHFWDLLHCLITNERGPKIKFDKIDASNMTFKIALKGATNYSDTLMEILKQDKATARALVNKAFQNNNRKSKNFWKLLHCLITDENGPKIEFDKIDASNMTPFTALEGAKNYSDTLIYILEKDQIYFSEENKNKEKKKNKNKAQSLFEEAINVALSSNTSLDSLKNLKIIIELLHKKFPELLTIEEVSQKFVDEGSNPSICKATRLVTEKIPLFSKQNLILKHLTLKKLARLYKKYTPIYNANITKVVYTKDQYENNINFITEVLALKKDTILEIIRKELNLKIKPKQDDGWEHLQELLDYNNKTGIPALNLSYATIDLSFDLLFKYSENKSRNNIIADMVKKQPKKGVHFIIEAVKHINDKKAWILLHAVFTGLPDVNLKDKFNDNDNIKALPVKHYLTAMVSKYMDKNNLLEITKKILEISAKTKQFAKEALQLLKSSGDNDKDKELHSHIWEILSKLVENHKDIKLELQELPYNRLPWNGKFQSTLKKLLSKQNLQNAQQLANKAFTDNDNQNSKHFWSFLSFLITDQNGPEVNATQIKATKMTLDTALKGAHNAPSTLMKILKQDQNSAPAVAFVNEAFKLIDQNSKNNLWELLHCLIIDTKGPKIDATQLLVQKFDEKVVFDAFSSQGNKKDVIESLLRSHPNEAKELVKEILSNQNLFSKQGTEELLHWLIFDSNTNNQGAIVPLANVNITIEAAVAIFHYLQSQPNPKLSEILNNVFRNNLLQGEAEKKVNDILNDDTELRKPANIELLHWLIFDSNTNNQGAIVPLANINITPKRAIEILQSQPNQKLSEILNSAIKTQPSIGKGMLEIAINGQTGSSLDWSNANVNFDLLHLLMLDPNGPQLTIKGADLASLDLPAIERHISKPNALQLFKTILHDPNNIDTFNAFRYAIFPSNSNSNNTFDYQNVDWDRTKWGSIPALKELIKPIDLPEDIVVKKLQDDGFTHKAIVRDIVLTSSSNLLEKVLNIAFPNVTVTSTTPTPTITWPQSLSATNWDIVASLTDSQHGIIKAKEVIQKVVPGISSSHLNFAKDYDLSSVRWGDLDWEAFEGLAEQSNIASFSIQNYLTIAENVLPGLQFVNQEPEVSQIDWDQIKSYKVVNFLIEKEIIPKKILINAPRSLLKQRINNISRLSLAEADFWKNTQEEKSKYYWSFAPYAVGLVLASAITLYVFNKQTKKNKKKRGSHNKAAKVKTQHNKDNKQHQKIIGNPIHTNRN